MPATAAALQTDMDNAEGGITPLGVSQNAIPFDINPYQVTGANPTTHFEQIYARALVALNNAQTAFDAAATATQVLRAGNDDQASFQESVDAQELAFTNQLVAIYGTPYPDDEGPGQTYAQSYNGPDLIHYMYVDRPDETLYGAALTNVQTFKIDTTQLPSDWQDMLYSEVTFVTNSSSPDYTNYIEFQIGPDGFFDKPANWTSERRSDGSIQQAISAYILAHDALDSALKDAVNAKLALDKAIQVFVAQVSEHSDKTGIQAALAVLQNTASAAQTADAIYDKLQGVTKDALTQAGMALKDAVPESVIVGLATGGDVTSTARSAIDAANASAVIAIESSTAAADAVTLALKGASRRHDVPRKLEHCRDGLGRASSTDGQHPGQPTDGGSEPYRNHQPELVQRGQCQEQVQPTRGPRGADPATTTGLPRKSRRHYPGIPGARRRLPPLSKRGPPALQDSVQPGRAIRLYGSPGL